jgi:hypothetical protein
MVAYGDRTPGLTENTRVLRADRLAHLLGQVFDATDSNGSSSALGDTTLPATIVHEYARLNATGFLNGCEWPR